MISASQNISRQKCMCFIGYVIHESRSRYLKEGKNVFSYSVYRSYFTDRNEKFRSLRQLNLKQINQIPRCNLRQLTRTFPVKSLDTEYVPKDPDSFGNLSFRESEKIEMDEDERKEEEFTEREARIPHKFRPPDQYVKKIKSYIGKKDLDAALNVLDLMKENRDKPTTYIYNLLIYAFAVQGDLKQCFHLYAELRKRGLKATAATYTSLFNACASSKNSQKALEHLNDLRQHLIEIGFPNNKTHYHVMIKAYSLHNCIAQAFELVDEMRDKMIYLGKHTYNSLLFAANCDKKHGLRYTLKIWHLMRMENIKPNIDTYNLLLRAIRDTEFGTLKSNDILIEGKQTNDTKINITDEITPSLLASPPAVNTLLPTLLEKKNSDIESIDLNKVLLKNRLILFGGYTGFLEQMDKDNVKPDIKTISLLLDLIPNNISLEEEIIRCAKSRNIELDVDFYNMLIKKRSMNHQYSSAKDVLCQMQSDNIRPNIMTFGVLALSCHTLDTGMQLIEGMESTGYAPNNVILGALIRNGCITFDMKYVSEIINYMRINRIPPSEKTFEIIDTFITKAHEFLEKGGTFKVKYQSQNKYIKRATFKDELAQFKEKYYRWKKKIEEKQRRKYKNNVLR